MTPIAAQHLYSQMLRIRRVEEAIAVLYPEHEMRCPVHLSIGQEAVAVGVCANLGRHDYVMSNHRSHAHYLAKGGSLRAMLAELYGKATGCCQGRGGSMHLIDLAVGFLGAVPIVASTIPIAVGAALGTTMRREERVTVVFFGDGAVEEGVFHESMNFAAVKRLPIVFVCENNFYAVYSPLDVRQPHGREIVSIAPAHGMDSVQGDGNSVTEVHDLTQQAVAKARHGGGPSLLEFKTYRWREHCGPHYDNNLGYRSDHEFRQWQERCPLATFQETLLRDGTLRWRDIETLESEIRAEIEDAVEFAKESPLPKDTSVLEHIYAA